MKATLFSIVIFIILSLPTYSQTIPDSLLTIDNIYNYTFTDYDKAMQIAKLMRQKKMEPPFQLDMAEGDLLYNNGKYNQAVKLYSRVLESDSVKHNDERSMKLMHRMISVYERLHNEEKKKQYIEMLLHKSQAANDTVMESIAMFNMGRMLYDQKDTERSYRLMQDAIELMENSDYEYKEDNLIYNYYTLYVMQQKDGLYEEALKTLDKQALLVESITDEDFNMEGIYRKEKKTLYATRAYVLSKLNREKEAADNYAKWKAMGDINSKEDYLINPYLMTIGEYDEIIKRNTDRENRMRANSDTINYHMRTLKRSTGRAYAEKGDYKKASDYFYELAALTDSLKIREQRSAALELATVYETAEKEAEIQMKDVKIERQRIIIWSIFSGFVIIIIALLVILWLYRKRNAAYLLLARKAEEWAHSKNTPSTPVSDKNSNENNQPTPEDYRIMSLLENEMNLHHSYREPGITMESLADRLNIHRNTLSRASNRVTGNNFAHYINSYRIREAVRIISETDRSQLYIDELYERVGFSNRSSFYRTFKQFTGLSPIEFQKKKGSKLPETDF